MKLVKWLGGLIVFGIILNVLYSKFRNRDVEYLLGVHPVDMEGTHARLAINPNVLVIRR